MSVFGFCLLLGLCITRLTIESTIWVSCHSPTDRSCTRQNRLWSFPTLTVYHLSNAPQIASHPASSTYLRLIFCHKHSFLHTSCHLPTHGHHTHAFDCSSTVPCMIVRCSKCIIRNLRFCCFTMSLCNSCHLPMCTCRLRASCRLGRILHICFYPSRFRSRYRIACFSANILHKLLLNCAYIPQIHVLCYFPINLHTCPHQRTIFLLFLTLYLWKSCPIQLIHQHKRVFLDHPFVLATIDLYTLIQTQTLLVVINIDDLGWCTEKSVKMRVMNGISTSFQQSTDFYRLQFYRWEKSTFWVFQVLGSTFMRLWSFRWRTFTFGDHPASLHTFLRILIHSCRLPFYYNHSVNNLLSVLINF